MFLSVSLMACVATKSPGSPTKDQGQPTIDTPQNVEDPGVVDSTSTNDEGGFNDAKDTTPSVDLTINDEGTPLEDNNQTPDIGTPVDENGTVDTTSTPDPGTSDDPGTPVEDLTPPAEDIPLTNPDFGSTDTANSSGLFGQACANNSGCNSGICAPSLGGMACTQSCQGVCPLGYECLMPTERVQEISGVSFNQAICLSPRLDLCRPCNTDSQCRTLTGLPSIECVSFGLEVGSFCTETCTEDETCLGGLGCTELVLPAPEPEAPDAEPLPDIINWVCEPAAGMENCGCNFWSEFDAASTVCGAGECLGSRGCGTGALSECTGNEAPDPWDFCGEHPDEPCFNGEICDGVDNDCDAQTDEQMGTVTCGTGQCLEEKPVCVDGVMTPLGTNFDLASEEVCDGIDNDCDYQTDEGLGTTTCGVGECSKTINNCSGGELKTCDPFEEATDETCDLLDNDCDGEIDEGAGASCTSGVCIAGECQPIQCTNNVQDIGETDVDCGGTMCAPCGDGFNCASEADCLSGVCNGLVCQPVTCGDGIISGSETCDDSNSLSFDGCSNTCLKDAKHVVISEVALQPSGAEFIEIYNPSPLSVSLSRYYLADYKNYFKVTLSQGPPSTNDFRLRFPNGSNIASGEYLTISLSTASQFHSAYGIYPDYDLTQADANATAMDGEYSSLNSGLDDLSEMVILFKWKSTDVLITDIDYLVYGTTESAMDKSGEQIWVLTYEDDTPAEEQDPVATAAVPGTSLHRCDTSEGSEIKVGGNGFIGQDESSEKLSETWTVISTPSPGAPTDCTP
jgi:hypothetical protein